MENAKNRTSGNGKICYVEIPATDINESAAFYQAVFGWTVNVNSDGTACFDDGINEVSGTWVLGRKACDEAGLLISIMVDSAVETLKSITAHGGKVVKQWTMGSDEQLAWFNDPAGNLFGIYQHPGGGNGKICYVEIPAHESEQSANFYKAVFNWPLREDNHGNIAFDDGVGVVSGMWVTGAIPSAEPGPLIYILVNDIPTASEKIVLNGGKIVQPDDIFPKANGLLFSDPGGNVLGMKPFGS